MHANATMLTHAILDDLDTLDRDRIVTIALDRDTQILTYFDNAPTVKMPCDCISPYSHVVPNDGDLLVALEVQGGFSRATLYQYAEDGVTKLVYDEWRQNEVSRPFPSAGIPLIQIAKAFRIDLEDAEDDTRVIATLAYLPPSAVRTIRACEAGVRVRHKSGALYQVAGYYDYGFASNFLEKLA